MTSISRWSSAAEWWPINTTQPVDTCLDAIQNGDLAAIEEYVKANFDFFKTPLSNGELPLHFAVQKNQVSVLQSFLEKGADPFQKDHRDMNALDHAVVRKEEKAAALIIAYIIHKETNVTELFNEPSIKHHIESAIEAAKTGAGSFIGKDKVLLDLMLAGKGDPRILDSTNNTFAHYAVEKGDCALLKHVLEKGTPVDVPNGVSGIPLCNL